MHLHGIGTATPRTVYSKAECLAAFEASDWFARLDERAHWIARSVLQRDNGIETRHLAVDTLAEVFTIDADTLARRFARHAPLLAVQAARQALDRACVAPADIGAVIVSTCTGTLCPGLSGYVIEGLPLPPDVLAFDLVGQGCGAAVPNLQMGQALLASGQARHVLSVCVEISSAAMYLDNDPGVLISACLFGDGAGAAVLSAQPPAGVRSVRWHDSASITDPSQREALRFETRGGLLRNVLTRGVPALAAEHGGAVLDTVLARNGLKPSDMHAWILHAGGRDVLQALQQRLALQPADLRYSADMLRRYGNLSSAFVYFVLQAALANSGPGGAAPGWWWLSSFGAGFSCHGALLEVA
mgnify:CR=1 FL=1